MLRRKADEVPRHGAVPGSLTRRVRFRLARNGLAVGMMIVLLGAGTFVGARALNGPGSPKLVPPASKRTARPTPGTTPTSAPSPTTSASPVSPASPAACSSGQLRAVGTFEGAAGSRDGAVSLSNFSDVTCTLQGQPTITLLDHHLKPITSGVMYSSAPAGWVVNASPTPPGWPVVTLAPGKAALVRIRWSNWCPDGRSAPLWQIGVPGGAGVDINGFDAAFPPPSNGQGQPSTIEVGPFEPGG
ncbi:MAG: hypothetical protein QOG21_1447 [Actinomycetota bacterium]|nr:hypothetical protein [Actinomycetota bacterium]